MSPELLNCVELETGPDPKHAVIWLHGLGADGHDFEPIVDALALPEDVSIRFIFPHAPVRPVTINGGMSMRAWYDFLQLIPGKGENRADVTASVEAVKRQITHELERGIPEQNIVLAGFSQGGVIALMAGLFGPCRLAGIMGLSTYLPRWSSLPAGENMPPVFLAHGRFDDVLPYTLGAQARDDLIGAGYDLEWHEYPMPHSVSNEEIEAIGRWLQKVLVR
jgi:phospholipase/carboxylesterase